MKFSQNNCDVVIVISVCNEVCCCILNSLEIFVLIRQAIQERFAVTFGHLMANL